MMSMSAREERLDLPGTSPKGGDNMTELEIMFAVLHLLAVVIFGVIASMKKK